MDSADITVNWDCGVFTVQIWRFWADLKSALFLIKKQVCLTSLVIYYMHNLSSWFSGIVGMVLHVESSCCTQPFMFEYVWMVFMKSAYFL